MNDNFLFMVCYTQNFILITSVADPDPEPNVFGPPGSAPVSHEYGSGSGFESFHHQVKIVRKTLTSTVFQLLYDSNIGRMMKMYQCLGSVPMFLGLPDTHPD
jgi:hypothetical protein